VSEGEPLPFDYRFEHVAQVTALALRLARALGADLEVVEAAGWLHDVRKGQPSHAQAGANAARTILAATDFPPAKIEIVADAISKHEGLFREPDAPPLQPLIDQVGCAVDSDQPQHPLCLWQGLGGTLAL
jgi:uncharacterized protein